MREGDIESTETVDLSSYIRVVRERLWVIILAVVVVVAAAVAVSVVQTPKYRATSGLLYQKSSLDQALFGSQVFSNPNPVREVQTGADLVESEPVVSAVSAQLGAALSPGQLRGMVKTKLRSNSNVLEIEVVDTDPERAAAAANAFAEQFILFRQQTDRATVAAARDLVKQELDTLSTTEATSSHGMMLKDKYENLRILESMQNGGFTIVQQAVAPRSAFAPQPVRNGILGLVVGLVLGVGLAFLLDYLDRRVKDEKAFERELGAPVLATVPAAGGDWQEGKKGERSRESVGFRHHPSLIEPFRTLRSSLQYFDVDSDKHIYIITSGLPKEGKTTTTINLALSLAVSGKRVIVVEADLRRPMINDYLGIGRTLGLSSVLSGGRELEGDPLQLVRADDFLPLSDDGGSRLRSLKRNLYVLPSGPMPPNPAELLASDRMGSLIMRLSDMADYILIDTPPLLLVSDALVLGKHTNGIILTSRLGSTTRDELQDVRTMLERADLRVVGAVALGAKRSPAYYRKRGYDHDYEGYGYGA